ncbi:hypothetical protein CHS0354_040857 [Potamilus streckersoni]|uniref:Uncharacterized protein n=1 Tax=Potamilus streckersoni TaxID=2493646 RepID=A0AAE0VXX7_9BIVA|nr:hypothetical protein CHS0354_040857 [Potamilus streckersoni]
MPSKRRQLLVSSVLFCTCGVLILIRCLCCTESRGLTSDIIIVGLFLLSVISYDVSRLSPAESHTYASICSQYVCYRVMDLVGMIALWRFKRNNADSKTYQASLLTNIINENKDTKMGKYLRLSQMKHVDEYLSKVILTDYSFYERFREVIIDNGEPDVLFRGKTDYIAITSGSTSGKSKMFPKKKRLAMKFGLYLTLLQYFLQNTKGNKTLRRIQSVRVYPTFTYSKHNVAIGPISGLTANGSLSFFLTPLRGGKITTEPEAFYISLLFSLAEEELGNIIFPNSSMALRYFKLLEKRWEELLSDLENRNISENIQIPEDIRSTFITSLYRRERSERIHHLRKEFRRGFQNIVPRIWPSCASISCVSTGAYKVQTDIIKERYLGDVSVLCFGHIATETIYGLNFAMDNCEEEYVCMTPINFYEFIRLEDIEKDQPRTYLTHQVEKGKLYEMVVTTWDGLYRYRSQDIVQITGFYGTTPMYKFVQRTGEILSLDTVKVHVHKIATALDEISRKWTDKSLCEYTTVENCYAENIEGGSTGEMFFVIFVELQPTSSVVSKEDVSELDSFLMLAEEMYGKARRRGSLQPCQVWQVSQGTFDAVMDIILASNPEATAMQFKSPKITRRPDILKHLLSRRID